MQDTQATQTLPARQIRAAYTPATLTVYQAYAPHLGDPAARDGRFPAAWKGERMTWIFSAPMPGAVGNLSYAVGVAGGR